MHACARAKARPPAMATGEGQRRRAAAAAMVGIFAFKVAYAGFMPNFQELLLSRACVSLGLPAYGDDPACCGEAEPCHEPCCANSDAASKLASIRSGYYNLATTLPALATVSMYAMLADVYGRKVTLSLCFASGLLQTLIVWLMPAGKVCLGAVCISDSFWAILSLCGILSAFGSWNVALGTSFAVVADLTEGPHVGNRAMLFGIMEAFNISGSIAGPWASGWLAKHFGLQHSFLFSVVGCGLALFCSAVLYVETLAPQARKKWTWANANPIGAVYLLFQHNILVRFMLVLLFVDMAQNNQFTLYYTRLANFDEQDNGNVTSVAAASCALGLLVVLPVLTKYVPMKRIVVFSVAGSTASLFMNVMLAWPSIERWPGVRAWPYWVAATQFVLALWYPPMRAIAATLFGPERFAVALGAVATVQTTNMVVGPTIWPLIYAASLQGCADPDDSSPHTQGHSGSGSTDDSGGDGSTTSGMCSPAFVFYVASGWSLVGCLVACTFPSLEKEDLMRAAAALRFSSVSVQGEHSTEIQIRGSVEEDLYAKHGQRATQRTRHNVGAYKPLLD
jgi:MFS family permease